MKHSQPFSWNPDAYPEAIRGLFLSIQQKIIPPIVCPDFPEGFEDNALKRLRKECSIVLTDGGVPASKAFIDDKGKIYIGITTGFVLALLDIAQMFSCSEFVDLYPPCRNPIVLPIDRIDSVFNDYGWITELPEDAPLTDMLIVGADEKLRMGLAVMLMEFSLAWIMLHERAHILQGHVVYVKEHYSHENLLSFLSLIGLQKDFRVDDEFVAYSGEQLMLQGLEYDADYFATLELVTRNLQESLKALYSKELLISQSDVLYYSGVAIGFVMLLLRNMERRNRFDANHPQVETRFHGQLEIMKFIGQHLPDMGLASNDGKRMMQGVIRVLEYSGSLSKQVGFSLLPSEKSFFAHGDKELLGSESRAKLDMVKEHHQKVIKKLKPYL